MCSAYGCGEFPQLPSLAGFDGNVNHILGGEDVMDTSYSIPYPWEFGVVPYIGQFSAIYCQAQFY